MPEQPYPMAIYGILWAIPREDTPLQIVVSQTQFEALWKAMSPGARFSLYAPFTERGYVKLERQTR
jgi:hypothetical protein